MAEYIDRKQAITEIIKTYEYEFPTASGAFDEFVTRILPNVLKGIPAADVAPVRHGRWIEPPRLYYGAKQYECSLCYSDTFWNKHSITEKYLHCPNCGAMMDLK